MREFEVFWGVDQEDTLCFYVRSRRTRGKTVFKYIQDEEEANLLAAEIETHLNEWSDDIYRDLE